MILYNVTVNVESDLEEEWIAWMKEVHIPEVLDTGCFTGHKFLKLMNKSPEEEETTYAIQYFAEGISNLNYYLENHASTLQKKTIDRYQYRCIAFRTFLEEV